MMARNNLLNIPQLRGRRNYDNWAFALRNLSIFEGINSMKSEAISELDDRQSKAKIVMTIIPTVYVHITNETTVGIVEIVF